MSPTTPTLLGLVLLSCFTSSHAYTLRPSINNLQAATTSRSTQACMSDVTVMMNGLPGAMGLEIAAACLRREGVALAPFALTGPGCAGEVGVDKMAGDDFRLRSADARPLEDGFGQRSETAGRNGRHVSSPG